MNLDIQTMMLIILMFIVGYAAYSANKLKSQIWCSFRRADKTKIEKWAKAVDIYRREIKFDGGWYNIKIRRVTLMLWTKGIHSLIPIWVRSLDFRYDSNMPIDPDTGDAGYDDPLERRALDKSDDLAALMETQSKSLGSAKKKSALESYMPIIVILGFLISGYMIYNLQGKVDMLGQAINVLQSMMMGK